MLVRLETSEVNKFWPIFKKALGIMNGVIEEPDKILAALLNESIQCWLIMDDEDSLIGFATTQLWTKEPEKTKVLFVRDLYSLNGIPDNIFIDGQKNLEIFAKSNGCVSIVAHTNNKFAVAKALRFGYKAATMVIKEVE